MHYKQLRSSVIVCMTARLDLTSKTEQNQIVRTDKSEVEVTNTNNKCIEDDTKAAARQSPNYIRKTK